MAYPFSYGTGTGVQLMEIDQLRDTSGTAYPQAASPALPPSQGYGLTISGANIVSLCQQHDIAEFITSSDGFSGIVDINADQGNLTADQSLNGTYSSAIDSNGRGAASTNFFNYNFYFVNSSLFLVLETDPNPFGGGQFELQNAS